MRVPDVSYPADLVGGDEEVVDPCRNRRARGVRVLELAQTAVRAPGSVVGVALFRFDACDDYLAFLKEAALERVGPYAGLDLLPQSSFFTRRFRISSDVFPPSGPLTLSLKK